MGCSEPGRYGFVTIRIETPLRLRYTLGGYFADWLNGVAVFSGQTQQPPKPTGHERQSALTAVDAVSGVLMSSLPFVIRSQRLAEGRPGELRSEERRVGKEC